MVMMVDHGSFWWVLSPLYVCIFGLAIPISISSAADVAPPAFSSDGNHLFSSRSADHAMLVSGRAIPSSPVRQPHPQLRPNGFGCILWQGHGQMLPLTSYPGHILFFPSLRTYVLHLFLQGSKKGGATYADMIAHSLSKVENGKGAFTEICDIIESKFSEFLNWKLERCV